MLKGLILSGATAGVWALGQLVLFRVRRPRSALVFMLEAFISALPVYFFIYQITPPTMSILPGRLAATPASLGLWNGFLVLALLFLTWMLFYYHINRSITLRLIAEFERTPSRSMTLPQIEGVCGLQLLVGGRVNALLRHGFVLQRADRCYLTATGGLTAVVARVMRKLFRLKPY